MKRLHSRLFVVTSLLLTTTPSYAGEKDEVQESKAPAVAPSTSPRPKKTGIQDLAPVEIKSIAQFLEQKEINQLAETSHPCNSGVSAATGGLQTFRNGRQDIVWFESFAKLRAALQNGVLNRLYAAVVGVSIQDVAEMNELLNHPGLQKHMKRMVVNYVYPFQGKEFVNSIGERLQPFEKLESIQIVGASNDEPSQAFRLIENKDWNGLEDLAKRTPNIFKIKRVPKNQARTDVTLAHVAAMHGYTEAIRIIAKYAPETLEDKNTEGSTPAYLAMRARNIEALKIIAQAAPKTLGFENSGGLTPAHVAARIGNIEALKIIVQAAPHSFSLRDGEHDKTALDWMTPEIRAEVEPLLNEALAKQARDAKK